MVGTIIKHHYLTDQVGGVFRDVHSGQPQSYTIYTFVHPKQCCSVEFILLEEALEGFIVCNHAFCCEGSRYIDELLSDVFMSAADNSDTAGKRSTTNCLFEQLPSNTQQPKYSAKYISTHLTLGTILQIYDI